MSQESNTLNDYSRTLGKEPMSQGDRERKWTVELDANDVRLINELGTLTADQLAEKISALQTNAYLLGVEEAKQMQRASIIGVLGKDTSSHW